MLGTHASLCVKFAQMFFLGASFLFIAWGNRWLRIPQIELLEHDVGVPWVRLYIAPILLFHLDTLFNVDLD